MQLLHDSSSPLVKTVQECGGDRRTKMPIDYGETENPRCSMATLNRLMSSGAMIGFGVASLFTFFGCNRVNPQANTTVQGRITFQGQPMSGGLVVFSPDVERGGTGKPISSEITQDGR